MLEEDLFPNNNGNEDQWGFDNPADFSGEFGSDGFSNQFSNDFENYSSDSSNNINAGSKSQDFTKINILGRNFTLGYKTTGILVASVLVVIGFLMLIIGSIKVVKKDDTSNLQANRNQVEIQTQAQAEASTQNQSQSEVVHNQENTYSSSGTSIQGTGNFVTIPDDMQINYNASIQTSQGTVSKLSRYLQNNQVVYCVEVSAVLGVSTTSVKYYCGYNTYRQLNVGDSITVEYQQVSDTCFSVLTLRK